jgi:hypothetical protein
VERDFILAVLRRKDGRCFSWLLTPVWSLGHVYLLAVLIQSCETFL